MHAKTIVNRVVITFVH